MARGIRGNTIRSYPGPCNKEQRRSQKRINAESAFGVYRPLTDESRQKVALTVSKVQSEVEAKFGEKPSQHVSFDAHKAFGATYLMRGQSHKALRWKQIDSATGPLLQRALEENSGIESEIEVPLFGFGWFGNNDSRRKFGGYIGVPQTNEFDERRAERQMDVLAADTRQLDDVLTSIDAPALIPMTLIPGHVSLFNYSTKSHTSVEVEQRNTISNIAYEHFEADGLSTVTLGKFVVGSYYSQPIDLAA